MMTNQIKLFVFHLKYDANINTIVKKKTNHH